MDAFALGAIGRAVGAGWAATTAARNAAQAARAGGAAARNAPPMASARYGIGAPGDYPAEIIFLQEEANRYVTPQGQVNSCCYCSAYMTAETISFEAGNPNLLNPGL